ncbi:MAG: ABC transporter substrate-binding protein [Suipraeoptans sp.]
MKKKIFTMLLCATMLVGTMSGCGNSSSSDSDSSSSGGGSDNEVVIEVFSNLPDRTSGQGLVEQMLFDQYMEENPNVMIEVEALEDASYKNKFKAYASGSDMPDFVQAFGMPSFLDEVIEAGLIAELNVDDYADYNFKDGTLKYYTINEKLYGLPRNTDVQVFYYNKALFEEYNVEIPETYDDLLALADVFNDSGIIPVSFDGVTESWNSIYLNGLYQQFQGSDAASEVQAAVETGDYSNEAWVKALDLVQQAIDVKLFQTGFETTDYGTAKNLFTNGQAAMFYMGSWEMSMATNQDIPEEIRNNIGIFNMPTVKDGKGTVNDLTAWNGGGYAVTEKSDVKEEAIKLLNYMMHPDNWTKLCWENGICMSAQNFSDYKTGEETQLQLDFVEMVDSSTSFTGITFNDLGTNEFKTISENASAEVFIGKINQEEFLQKLSEGMK